MFSSNTRSKGLSTYTLTKKKHICFYFNSKQAVYNKPDNVWLISATPGTVFIKSY